MKAGTKYLSRKLIGVLNSLISEDKYWSGILVEGDIKIGVRER